MQQGLDLLQIIHKGAIATYPLIVMSVISVAVVFERFWSLKNIGSVTLRLTEAIMEPLSKGQKELALAMCKQNSQCPAARIFMNVITRCGGASFETVSAFAAEAMFEETQKLRKHLWILNGRQQCPVYRFARHRYRDYQVLRKYGHSRNRRFYRGSRRDLGGPCGHGFGIGSSHHCPDLLQLLPDPHRKPERSVSHPGRKYPSEDQPVRRNPWP